MKHKICRYFLNFAFGFSQVEKLEDSFKIIQSKPKPLAAYLFTNDEQLKKNFVQNISSGGMLINDTIIHVTTLFLIHTEKIDSAQFPPMLFYYINQVMFESDIDAHQNEDEISTNLFRSEWLPLWNILIPRNRYV